MRQGKPQRDKHAWIRPRLVHWSIPGAWTLTGFRVLVAFSLLALASSSLRAGAGGSISGTVVDPQGAIIFGAEVIVVNTETNYRSATITDTKGFYSFRELSVGSYELHVDVSGFKSYRRTGLAVDANGALIVDVSLVIGERKDTVTVIQAPVSVESENTQLGEVVSGQNITAVPLNGRSFTDLLALQPGVAPMTTITGTSIQAAGASAFSPAGYLDPGTISINGQREYANGFSVNDADVVERFTMGAAVIPNLDSIAEFRILTGNFDAEYGNYSGGRINVVTRSGSNQLHGSTFEFLRNTALDAKNFFSQARGVFQQNQFGGTVGGPVFRNHVFFFADYQGTRLKQGLDTGRIAVPSLQDRSGNLSDLANAFVTSATVNGQAVMVPATVKGQYWADQLSQRFGYPVSTGEPYYIPGCTTSAQCVLPNAVIPQSAWSAPAVHLLQYIPQPNLPGGLFSTSSENLTLRDDKTSLRLDGNTRWGLLSAYYFFDDYTVNNPYPTQQGGANVPGFNAVNTGRAQLLTLGNVRSFGGRTVNEFHFSFVRDVNVLGNPVGGVGAKLADQGFVTSQGIASIIPNRPQIEGIENTIFNSYTVGTDITGLNQYDNTFEFRDNLSRVIGTHILKFGGESLYSQVNAFPDVQSNGTFTFVGTETGIDFADFLLGIPSRYTQGDAQAFYMRNKYGALFLQDSWRVKPRLTLNYGVRWDVIMPWYEKYNQIQTLVPGQQSIVFPGAPKGLVFPTDPGVSRSLAPTRWNNVSPRLGLAYSPGAKSGILRRLFGNQGQSSIRAGVGRFFSAVEGVSAGVMAGDAPYGQTYTSPAPPIFSNPFLTASTGQDNGQRFPLQYPSLNASAANPNSNINWANFLPVTGLPGYYPENVSPYTEQYTVSLQRQIGTKSLLTVIYVGSQSHHLLTLLQANPGNPGLCLSVSKQDQVTTGSPICGPFGEGNVYTAANGQILHGTRGPLGSAFGSVDWLITNGNSNYNALELTFRHTNRRAEILAGYTYGKSLDNSSSISDQLIPGNYRLTYGLSAFDIRHNFVTSYRYEIPFDQLFRARNRFTTSWIVSGITRISSGFPVTFYNKSDNSLLGTQPDGVNAFGADLPQMTPGPLNLNHNPRNRQPYFNTSLFSVQPLGTPGNVARRFFSGPGQVNFDMALLKNLPLHESKSVQFRLETFNLFNHAQFFGPSTVDGNLQSSTFGQAVSAAAPRLVQLALKFSF
jgi:carboxypeptidase family protein/TonB-dependent receptor-like protein